jgi:hypothetical protein
VLAGVGLVSCFLAWIVGLVLGIVGLSQIKGSDGTQTGRGVAIGGSAANAGLLVVVTLLVAAVVLLGSTAEDTDDFERICSGDVDGDGIDDCSDVDDLSSTTSFSIPR